MQSNTGRLWRIDRLWARHDVTESAKGTKAITHPHGGDLHFEYTRLPCRSIPVTTWFCTIRLPAPARWNGWKPSPRSPA
ncbi:hypothetical protein [Nocardia flavorosea]|uniref:MmyB-like transcription regulator ligand binding domain-containing protein n=1 Tax=Nocardia flavorosea TaxID=53429 RepID=A0A846YBR2_9NOCA|nr:hypothetical protein [Nocardia flavorosea]NKY55194.1 hypothetical protein [Nocardia flavorosea]